MSRELIAAALVGFPEALVVGLPAALAAVFLWPAWAGGLLWGLAALASGRLLGLAFLLRMPRRGRVELAAGLMGAARLLVVGGIALGGIALGLSALGVAVGLALPPLGLWAKYALWRRVKWQGN